MRQFTDVKNAT